MKKKSEVASRKGGPKAETKTAAMNQKPPTVIPPKDRPNPYLSE